MEALHAAFVAPPANPSGNDDEDRPRVVLADLAWRLGVPLVTAKQWAVLECWYQERAAAYARAWAALHYPGVPLDLEGFAKHVAEERYSHLPDRVALAVGRELWYRALAPLALWEENRIILENRRRVQAEREAARRAA